MKQELSAGQKVMLIAQSEPPGWCEFDDDRGRVAKHVKKTILDRFFKCDNKLTCEIVHVVKEGERIKLRKSGRTKVRIRTPAGESIIVPVEIEKLKKV